MTTPHPLEILVNTILPPHPRNPYLLGDFDCPTWGRPYKVTLPGYEVNSRTTIRIPSMLNVREVDAFCLRKILENFRNFSWKKKISLFQWRFLFFLVPRNKMKRFKWKQNFFRSWAIYGLSHFLNFHRSFIHSWLKGNFFPSDNFEISNINFWLVLYFTVNQGKKSIFIRNWKTKFQSYSFS